MKDGIPRWLQYCHEMCCEKDSCYGRRACMIRRWFHHRDVISGQVDLHMTVDEYVIKIYHDINIQNMIFNGLLEGYRNISKAKYHYKPFK